MRGKQWSVEEERQLRELINQSVSYDEIAEIMGKTRLAIRGKINNLRLTVVVAAAKQHKGATTTITTTLRPTLSTMSPLLILLPHTTRATLTCLPPN
jgi:hypothetical protein